MAQRSPQPFPARWLLSFEAAGDECWLGRSCPCDAAPPGSSLQERIRKSLFRLAAATDRFERSRHARSRLLSRSYTVRLGDYVPRARSEWGSRKLAKKSQLHTIKLITLVLPPVVQSFVQ